MKELESVRDVVVAHRNAGRLFDAGGVRSFVRRVGEGAPIVHIHGLPASSFLYRKVLTEVAARGFEAIAFDLPGLGLAERPQELDYSLPGLSQWCVTAVNALGLDRFHLVVHDAGGPVGFGLITRIPEQIMSLTILDTVIEAGDMPFPGEVYARFTNHMYGPMAARAAWRQLMLRVGIGNAHAVSEAELDAYRILTLGNDRGFGYVQIMKQLRTVSEFDLYPAVVDSNSAPYPIALVWAEQDPILPLRTRGQAMLKATGLPAMTRLPGKHYFQEDQAAAIANVIAGNATNAG